MNNKPLIGKVFGRLTVQSYAGADKHRQSLWRAVCACGALVVVRRKALSDGTKRSCGCDSRRRAVREKIVEQKVIPRSRRPEYRIWMSMKMRCAPGGHPRYAGRGIRVHPEWEKSFDTWFAYMGPRPSDQHSIDRKDNDGHYEPGNVRWATRVQQANNVRRRNERRYSIMGREYKLSEIAAQTGISIRVLRRRLAAGMTIEKAATTPKRAVARSGSDDRVDQNGYGVVGRSRGRKSWANPDKWIR